MVYITRRYSGTEPRQNHPYMYVAFLHFFPVVHERVAKVIRSNSFVPGGVGLSEFASAGVKRKTAGIREAVLHPSQPAIGRDGTVLSVGCETDLDEAQFLYYLRCPLAFTHFGRPPHRANPSPISTVFEFESTNENASYQKDGSAGS